MDSEAGGQVGGMTSSEGVRRRFAVESGAFRCAVCGRANAEIMRECEERVTAEGSGHGEEEVVPDELRLGYKDQLGKEKDGGGAEVQAEVPTTGDRGEEAAKVVETGSDVVSPSFVSATGPVQTTSTPALNTQQGQRVTPRDNRQTPTPVRAQPIAADTAWIDKAIIGVGVALAFMVFHVLFM